MLTLQQAVRKQWGVNPFFLPSFDCRTLTDLSGIQPWSCDGRTPRKKNTDTLAEGK